MRGLIRWYNDSPPVVRVVFHHGPVVWRPVSEFAPHRARRRILVVCFGNACRSPLAAAMFSALLPADRFEVFSAGTNAPEGKTATEFARIAGAKRSLSLRGHGSRKLSAELVRNSDLIFTMSRHQAAKVVNLDRRAARRIRLLGAFAPRHNVWGLPADPMKAAADDHEICDPVGEDLEFHYECAERLATAVKGAVHWIAEGADPEVGPDSATRWLEPNPPPPPVRPPHHLRALPLR